MKTLQGHTEEENAMSWVMGQQWLDWGDAFEQGQDSSLKSVIA